MILCICQAVTDREIDAAIRAGARCVDDVAAACGAANDCGCCRGEIEQRIESACGRSCADCPRREPAPAPAAAGGLGATFFERRSAGGL